MLVVARVVGLVLPLRATARSEALGLDLCDHGEEAYAEGDGAILIGPDLVPSVMATATVTTEGGRA